MVELDALARETVGLDGLPDHLRTTFLKVVHGALKARIGERLSEGLDDDVLNQFQRMTEHDPDVVSSFLDQHRPGWRAEDLGAVPAEVAANLWLKVHCPHHAVIVDDEFAGLLARVRAFPEWEMANSLFSESMLATTGLAAGLAAEHRAELSAEVCRRVVGSVMDQIGSRLAPARRSELSALIGAALPSDGAALLAGANPDMETLAQWYARHVPDRGAIVATEVVEMASLLGIVGSERDT